MQKNAEIDKADCNCVLKYNIIPKHAKGTEITYFISCFCKYFYRGTQKNAEIDKADCICVLKFNVI